MMVETSAKRLLAQRRSAAAPSEAAKFVRQLGSTARLGCRILLGVAKDQARETPNLRSEARQGVARAMSGAHSVVRARTIALRRCEKSLNTSSGVRIVLTVLAACCVLCSTQRH